jgi:hypothetical protein
MLNLNGRSTATLPWIAGRGFRQKRPVSSGRLKESVSSDSLTADEIMALTLIVSAYRRYIYTYV